MLARAGVLAALTAVTVIAPVAGVPDALGTPPEPAYANRDILDSLQQASGQVIPAEGQPLMADPATVGRNAAALRASRTQIRTLERCDEDTTTANGTDAATVEPAPEVDIVVHPLAEGTYRVSSPYGFRTLLGHAANHAGVDFAAPMGTPIHAVADGVVEYVGPGKAGRSDMLIILRHVIDGDVYRTWHVHMYPHGVHVQLGQEVKAGEVIGAVGSNGRSTGPHLHFEVHLDDNHTTTEPLAWLEQVGAAPPGEAPPACP